MRQLYRHIYGDKVIWGIVFLLAIVSVLLVYSSTGQLAYSQKGGNTEYFAIRHAIIMALGFGLMYVTHKMKYSYFSRISQLLIMVAIPLLLFTLIKGTNLNSAARWIRIGGISFQTSDLGKFALILYLARGLAIHKNNLHDFKKGVLPLAIPIFLVCGFILPADLSTAMMLFGISMIILFMGGVALKHIGNIAGIAMLSLGIFISVAYTAMDQHRIDTWKKRIETFFVGDDDGNYQAALAKGAIANGGVMGTFWASENIRKLPHPYSDFAYASIMELTGLIGGMFVLMLYLMFLFRAVKIVQKTESTFAANLVIGLSVAIVLQALINMGVAVGLLPVTGQPLPMVSMGGTSVWFTCLSIGIILSVSKEIITEKEHATTESDH